MATRPIVEALTRLWPRERFAPDFEAYWSDRFAAYPADVVVHAIHALRHERDPHTPTCEGVEAILGKWDLGPKQFDHGRGGARAATPDEEAQMRDRFRRPPPEDEVAQTICDTLDDATFARLAAEAMATIHPDARATLARRPLRDSIFVKRLVADRVRAEVAA